MRSAGLLAAREGSILVVDAAPCRRPQTLATVYQAIDHDHEIVPVLNKVDLPVAEPARVRQQIEDVIGLDASNAIEASAKTGQGIREVLEAIVTRLPPPKGDITAPLKALVVDAWYDAYLGVVVLVRVFDGVAGGRPADPHDADSGPAINWIAWGCSSPSGLMAAMLGPGEIGFITAQIKDVADAGRRPHHRRALPGR